MRKVRIGGGALNQIPFHWDNNIANIKSAISDARKSNVEILCLPELCITGYGCEDMFLSEWLPAKAVSLLNEIIPYCEDMLVAVGLPVIHRQKVYNTTCIIENKEVKGFYAKHHLANDGVHYETRWFSSWPYHTIEDFQFAGNNYPIGDILLTYKDLKIGFEICEDAWREERPADNYHSRGAELLLNPSASHFAFEKAAFRENLIVSSSKKYGCVYLYSNLLGNEAGKMIYDGDIVIAQQGALLCYNKRLSFQDVNVLYTDVDFDNAENSLKLPNVDTKEKYYEFAKAASLGLFDYMRKAYSNGFVLSLSGGADSSSIAVLVAEMVRNGLEELGLNTFMHKLNKTELIGEVSVLEGEAQKKKIVRCLLSTAYQGTKNSSDNTFNSAKELANSIGADFNSWIIDDEVSSYSEKIEKVLGRELTWEKDDIAMQNIQARARSPIIWMLANIKNALLLTTSNRSEGDVGYTTMDGDTSGSISPIAGVDKDFIRKWLVYAEEQLGYKELKHVNGLAPTAELRPSNQVQTDEKDLMPYDIMVRIERLAIKDRLSPVNVFKNLEDQLGIDKAVLIGYIKKFYELWYKNQWKRERLAPSFQLDDFNVDPRSWCRFPILSGGFKAELKMLDKLLLNDNN